MLLKGYEKNFQVKEIIAKWYEVGGSKKRTRTYEVDEALLDVELDDK